jgi:hypothetical protein
VTEREAAYNAMLEELIGKVGKLTEAEVERALALLDEVRREVSAIVLDSDWKVYYVPQMQEAVGRAAEKLRQQYGERFDSAGVNLWNAGIDQVDWPLNYVGIRFQAPEISRAALEILQGYSADLIRNLTDSARSQINREIAMGVLGGKSPWEVMQAIGRSLEERSVFRNIASRAETITRTELGRINSAAREARMEAVVDAGPEQEWLKKWISSGKFRPRPHHRALHGVTVPFDQPFPGNIPYPHAPGLPAAETVNCGCSHVLTLPGWEKGQAWEPTAYQPRAIYD